MRKMMRWRLESYYWWCELVKLIMIVIERLRL